MGRTMQTSIGTPPKVASLSPRRILIVARTKRTVAHTIACQRATNRRTMQQTSSAQVLPRLATSLLVAIQTPLSVEGTHRKMGRTMQTSIGTPPKIPWHSPRRILIVARTKRTVAHTIACQRATNRRTMQRRSSAQVLPRPATSLLAAIQTPLSVEGTHRKLARTMQTSIGTPPKIPWLSPLRILIVARTKRTVAHTIAQQATRRRTMQQTSSAQVLPRPATSLLVAIQTPLSVEQPL